MPPKAGYTPGDFDIESYPVFKNGRHKDNFNSFYNSIIFQTHPLDDFS